MRKKYYVNILNVKKSLIAGFELNLLKSKKIRISSFAFECYLKYQNFAEIISYINSYKPDDIVRSKGFMKSVVRHAARLKNMAVFFQYVSKDLIDDDKEQFVSYILDSQADFIFNVYNRIANGYYLSKRMINEIPRGYNVLKIANIEVMHNYDKESRQVTWNIGASDIWNFSEIHELFNYLPFFLKIVPFKEQENPPKYTDFYFKDTDPSDRLILELDFDRKYIEGNRYKAFTIIINKKMSQAVIIRNNKDIPYLIEDVINRVQISKCVIPSNKLSKKLTRYTNFNSPIIKDIYDLRSLLKQLPGKVYVHLLEDKLKDLATCNSKSIQWSCWIPDLVPDLLRVAIENECIQTIELDATFSFPPYILILPQCVINNTGYPLGYYFGLSENSNAYRIFYERLVSSATDVDIQNVPILSDLHSSLESFCKSSHLIHWLCAYHFLKTIKDSVIMRGLIREVIYAEDEATYNVRYETYSEIVNHLNKNELVDPLDMEKWINLGKEEFKSKIARFKRDVKIMPSNHAEGNHGSLNTKMKEISSKNKLLKFQTMIEHIMSRFNQIDDPKNDNVMKLYRKLKISAIKNKVEQHCKCNCNMENVYKLYGVHIPCIHNILDVKPADLEKPKAFHIGKLEFNSSKNILVYDDEDNPIGKGDRKNEQCKISARKTFTTKVENEIYLYEEQVTPDIGVKSLVQRILNLPSIDKATSFMFNLGMNIDYDTIQAIHYISSLRKTHPEVIDLALSNAYLPEESDEYQQNKDMISKIIEEVFDNKDKERDPDFVVRRKRKNGL